MTETGEKAVEADATAQDASTNNAGAQAAPTAEGRAEQGSRRPGYIAPPNDFGRELEEFDNAVRDLESGIGGNDEKLFDLDPPKGAEGSEQLEPAAETTVADDKTAPETTETPPNVGGEDGATGEVAPAVTPPKSAPQGEVNLTADRQRIKNRITAAAVSIQRTAEEDGKPISLAEAERRAFIALEGQVPDGLAKDAEEAADAAPASTIPDGISSLREAEAREVAIATEIREANDALDFDRVSELTEELANIVSARPALAAREAEGEKAFRDADALTAELFPESRDANSPFTQRMVELRDQWRALGDDRLNRPDWILELGKTVARERGVNPASKLQATAPAAPAQPQPASSTRRATPPSAVGALSGSGSAPSSKPGVPSALDRITDIDSYNELAADLARSLR